MSKQEAVVTISIPANGSLASDQFKFVKVNSSGKALLVAASTDVTVGVLQDNPNAADLPAAVAISGRVKVVAGGTVASGGRGMAGATGLAVAATGSGNRVVGVALVGGVSGDLIEVLLYQSGYLIP